MSVWRDLDAMRKRQDLEALEDEQNHKEWQAWIEHLEKGGSRADYEERIKLDPKYKGDRMDPEHLERMDHAREELILVKRLYNAGFIPRNTEILEKSNARGWRINLTMGTTIAILTLMLATAMAIYSGVSEFVGYVRTRDAQIDGIGDLASDAIDGVERGVRWHRHHDRRHQVEFRNSDMALISDD